MITTSEQIASLAGALALAQAEIENAAKDGNNPHFKSKYASMEAVVYACKATLPKHGLSYVQFPGMQGDYVTVTTRLMHKSGEWIEGTLPMPVGKRDAHGVGSAISYARRYSLMAVIGIAAEDDDGNGAVAGGEVKSAPFAEPIGSEVALEIDALITEVGADRDALLRYYQVESLPMMTAAQAAQARKQLEKKRGQANATAQGAA